MGMFVNGMIGGYGALISDTYPLQIRATAQNVLFNLGRGVGGFGPLVIGLFVSHWSFTAAITLLALLYLLDIFATLFLLPKPGQRRCAGRDRLTPCAPDNKARVSPGFAHKIAISSRLSTFAGKASNGRNHRR